MMRVGPVPCRKGWVHDEGGACLPCRASPQLPANAKWNCCQFMSAQYQHYSVRSKWIPLA